MLTADSNGGHFIRFLLTVYILCSVDVDCPEKQRHSFCKEMLTNVKFQILSSTLTASLLTDPWIEESGKPFGFSNFWCSIYSTADTG